MDMLTFQQIIHKLTVFWEKRGCIIHQGHDLETGAGTFNPATFLRCLGPEPYKTAYVEPSRRPSDGRYGENPNRLQLFHQFQVIIKPSPSDILQTYKESLEAIGIRLADHDLRFVHDDWESPTLGAFGLGWEVWIDGMEVSQFTYFQGVASQSLKPISAEITYGLERLCMYVQNKSNFFEMQWNEEYTYGEICKENEVEWSHYNFTEASVEMWLQHFDDFEKEAKRLLARNLPIPAYDFVVKASHAFNLLQARGAISVTERTGYIARIRDLARLIAAEYLASREKQGFPLLKHLEEKPLPKAKPAQKSFDPHVRESFLLEIGSEELPATFVPIGMQNLENALRTLLKQYDLSFESIRIFGTPRRLGALISGLVEGTPEKTTQRKGPSLESAFDTHGKPTQQGMGFFKAVGVEKPSLAAIKAGEIKHIEIQNGYLFATLTKEGRSIYQILAEELPKLILHIDFPKKMRWGTLDILYPRPIHWIVALYGANVIPFVIGDVVTHNHTFGHAQLDPEKIVLKEAHTYFETLKAHKVLADVSERRQSILDQLSSFEKKFSSQIVEQKRVMNQVLFLSEWPMLMHGEFSAHFLEIPQEVLISEMIEHQKYFPLADQNGKLTNRFLITADNTPNEIIRAGNQRVLSARLTDGSFLYKQDLKVPLEHFNDKLKKMVFQKELGSMYEKVLRVQAMAEKLNSLLHLADPKKVSRAALLCKADLASEMVGEFPELQGTIGKYYALHQKEDKEVAHAIEEHWLPRMEGGPLPQTKTGIILSLADKLDNLASYFKVGLKPTASSDPYALRRQTIGILKILIENQLSLNLNEIFSNDEILTFITHRAKGVFEDYGFLKDEIEASLTKLCVNPFIEFCKVQALHAFRKTKSFTELFEVYKRPKGILEKQKAEQLDESLLKEPAEKEVHKAVKEFHKRWIEALKEHNYSQAYQEIAKLQKPLAHLFDSVKILDDNPEVRANRIALLQHVFFYFDQLLDFAKIQEK